LPVLGDEHVADRLAFPERDLPERSAERAFEEKRDRFLDQERAVGLDANVDVRLRQQEGLRLRRGRCREQEGESEGEKPVRPQN
jgi:hypothetical protein